MRFGPGLGFLVEPLDIGLQLVAVNPPHASSPQLDRRKATGADERVDLGNAHVQVRGDVLEGQEPGLGPRSVWCTLGLCALGAHIPHDSTVTRRSLYLSLFDSV